MHKDNHTPSMRVSVQVAESGADGLRWSDMGIMAKVPLVNIAQLYTHAPQVTCCLASDVTSSDSYDARAPHHPSPGPGC